MHQPQFEYTQIPGGGIPQCDHGELPWSDSYTERTWSGFVECWPRRPTKHNVASLKNSLPKKKRKTISRHLNEIRGALQLAATPVKSGHLCGANHRQIHVKRACSDHGERFRAILQRCANIVPPCGHRGDDEPSRASSRDRAGLPASGSARCRDNNKTAPHREHVASVMRCPSGLF